MLKRGTPLFTLVISLAIGAVALIVTQFVLPGTSGPGRGTPVAILFTGLVTGALNGLTAVGLVLIYRTVRVINFAQAAIGAMGAIFTYNLITVYNLPYGLAFLAGVIGSAFVIVFLELLIMRRFFDGPRLVLTILTIGIGSLVASQGIGVVSALPIWGNQRSLIQQFGGTPVVPVRSIEFFLGDVPIPFHFSHLLTLGMLAAVMVGIGAFLRYTRVGIAVRASAENTERAELLGINVRILSTVVWGIAGALSAISVILLGTNQGFRLGGQGAPGVLIAALAAAVIARMRSINIAVYAAIMIAVVQAALGWSFQDHGPLIDASLFVVIALGLLLQRRTLVRGAEGTAWEATQEMRPMPRELIAVPSIRTWRWIGMGIAGVFVLAFPWMTTSGQVNRASLAAITAIVLLSLVVLTGWAGQVSLAQFALVAVGALVGGAITSRAGLSFWLALPVGAIAAMAVALLIGLPALRIRGLFLGVVTLAFATAVSVVAFSDQYFSWLQPENIRRPTLLLVDFEDERSMYYLCLAFLGAVIALVLTLRRSRPGRVMIGLRENEADLEAFGINVVRAKLAAFALSGFICGLAGVLFAHHQRAVSQSAFVAGASINTFVYAVIGGIGSVSGALLGAAFQSAVEFFPTGDPVLTFFINPSIGLIAVLYVRPGGLAQIVYAVRDSVLRIVAQRRQMVVPALFADVDPAVLEKQLIPLSEPTEKTGLSALARRRGYRLDSELYKETVIEGAQEGAPDERAALAEVAERVGGAS